MERRTMHNSFSFLLGDGPPLTPILPRVESADTLNFRDAGRKAVRELWHQHVVLEGNSVETAEGFRLIGAALAQATTFDEVLLAFKASADNA
tara:strand:+ start:1275 stop:1550 length:276 start_codon:yes stop_codon:yes gene_type:complete